MTSHYCLVLFCIFFFHLSISSASTEINFNFNGLLSGSRPSCAPCPPACSLTPSPSSIPVPTEELKAILFSANTSICRIADLDATAVATGAADFTTVTLPNQDYSCSADSLTNTLTLTPKNGLTFGNALPNGPVVQGVFEHIKAIIESDTIITALSSNAETCTRWVANVQCTGLDSQPFGSAVVNPSNDVRLGTGCLSTLDPTFLMTFDWFLSDNTAYVLIERLPGLEAVFGYTYAAFSFLYPAFYRANLSQEYHEYQTCYNRGTHTFRWFVDGEVVLKNTAPGMKPNSQNTFAVVGGEYTAVVDPVRFYVADHGGIEPEGPISILNLQFGLATFTLLDWSLPNNVNGNTNTEMLVRLEENRFRNLSNGTMPYYLNPFTGQESNSFVVDCPLNSDGTSYETCIPGEVRNFGSGVILNVEVFEIFVRVS